MAADTGSVLMTQLSELNESKSKIDACTATCVSAPQDWEYNFQTIMAFVEQEERPVDQKVSYLYLIDAILRVALKKKNQNFAKKVSPALPTLFRCVAPSGVSATPKARKIVDHWRVKGIFDQATLIAAQQQTKLIPAVAKAPKPDAEVLEALFDFAGTQPGELKLQKGVQYSLLSQLDANWYHGSNAAGEQGMFPCTYVKHVTDATIEVVEESSKRKRETTDVDASKRPLKFTYESHIGTTKTQQPKMYDPALPTLSDIASKEQALPFVIRKRFFKAQNAFFYQNIRTKELSPMPPPKSPNTSVVHIFDLDETLIQFRDLVSGTFATNNVKDVATGKHIGGAFEQLIFAIAERHFFFSPLEDCNQCFVGDVAEHDDRQNLESYEWNDEFSWPQKGLPPADSPEWRKLAYRCRAMLERYEKVRNIVVKKLQQDATEKEKEELKEKEGTAFVEDKDKKEEPPTTTSDITDDTTTDTATDTDTTTDTKKEDVEQEEVFDEDADIYIASHAFEGQNGGLGFAAGSKMQILKKDPKGWWLAKIKGVEGWVPSSYLEEVKTEEVFLPLSDLEGLETEGYLDNEQLQALHAVHTDLRVFTDEWLETSIRLLKGVQKVENSVLVLVTNTELSAAFVKLLLFRLCPFFSADNVYSSSEIGKKETFKKIMDRYGTTPQYCGFGDATEEENVCKEFGIPFYSIKSRNDIKNLCREAELNSGGLGYPTNFVPTLTGPSILGVMPGMATY